MTQVIDLSDMISVQSVHKSYRVGGSQVEALRGVSLDIGKGEFVVIAGPSGSGKSTFLNLLAGLEAPDGGTITVGGVDPSALSNVAQSEWRAFHVGFVFQSFNLLSVLTTYENVEYPLALQGKDAAFRAKRVSELLQQVGLERFAKHRPAQLSGGQRQRLAVARAVAGSPAVILADEPTANLDHATGGEILRLLRDLSKTAGVTLVLSTHDPAIIKETERVIRFRDGLIENAA
jgi:putative ABC transport system ATP-binding protein